MMKRLLFVGLVMGGAACIWLAPSASAQETTVLRTEGGRYVFGQISEYRRDQFMLDTETGRLWVAVTTKDGEYLLQPVPYSILSIDGRPNSLTPLSTEIEEPMLTEYREALAEFYRTQEGAFVEKWIQVELGMGREDVRLLVGQPDSTKVKDRTRIWFYPYGAKATFREGKLVTATRH